MPVPKLSAPITSMRLRKPLRLSERCGVSTAENSVGSVRAALSGVMMPTIPNPMARKTPRKTARRASPANPRRTAQGLRKARAGTAAKVKDAGRRLAADRKAAAGATAPWTNAEFEEAFRRFQAANAEPKGELLHINPFTLLVAVVLSAQATDAGVNKATPALFAARRHARQDGGARRRPRAAT